MKAKYIAIAVSLLAACTFGARAQQPLPVPAAYPAGTHLNYVRTWEALRPGLDTGNIKTVPAAEAKQATAYFDGLGRPLQTVARAASPTGKDLVGMKIYDPFGRETLQYLPYVATASDGKFKTDPFAAQAAFAALQYPGETFFYGRTEYEPAPLNRPLKTMAPGNSWVGAGRGTGVKYSSNSVADSVALWRATNNLDGEWGSYSMEGYYAPGKLAKTIATDEHGKQVAEYKDNEGKVLLKKVQLTAAPDDGNGKGHTGWLCTYYIYDSYGGLRCVLQPKAVEILVTGNWIPSLLTGQILDELAFRYAYDAQGNMTAKKVPGAGAVYMVYDDRDRLAMTQDANQRTAGKWLYTQYDALNRPTATGLLTDGHNAAWHRAQAVGKTDYPELAGQVYEELTRTFYDDYTWLSGYATPLSSSYNTLHNGHLLGASNNVWPYAQAPVQSNLTKGMATGSRVKVLGTTDTYLYTVPIYDDKGRAIQTQSTNPSGGVDIATTQYSWAGQPLVNVVTHQRAGSAQLPTSGGQASTVITKLTYDGQGRLVKTEKKMAHSSVNGGALPAAFSTVAENEYDALGQLKRKTLAPSMVNGPSSMDRLETLDYDYNIRGWMLGANRGYINGSDNAHWFGFELGYDKPASIIAGQTYGNPQYNGNIGGSTWKAAGDGEKRKYDFGYDAANRLTGADFNQLTGGAFDKTAGLDFSVGGLHYDANENILGMAQKGWKLGASSFIDQMRYDYQANSNKLKAVFDTANDNASKLGDFKYDPATKGEQDYGYDANGNMILDNNKKISAIQYNHLNLPQTVTVTGQGSIDYVYDATGNKLKKTVHETNKPDKVTEYMAGFVYEDGQLQFAPQEEGRIRLAKQYYLAGDSAWTLQYDYFLKDHLGNIRTVLTAQRDTARYRATFETAAREKENALFANIAQTAFPIEMIGPGGNASLPGGTNGAMACRLNGSELKTGAALTLRVIAGDKVDIGTQYWYPQENAVNTEPIEPDDLFALLLGTVSGGASGLSGGKATAAELGTSGSPVYGALQDFLGGQTDPDNEPGKPKAYLNWILLDEQFKYVPEGSGFVKVDDYSAGWQALANTGMAIAKSGYLFVYLSNQTIGQNVFFDNLTVQHYTGPLMEETQYYPFGLAMAGVSSRAFGRLENKRKWNAGTELNTDLNINLYETNFRSLDPQLGRFWQIDPMADEQENYSTYTFGSDNPILRNDPLGLKDTVVNGVTAHIDKNYGEVTVTGIRHKKTAANACPNGQLPLTTSQTGALPPLAWQPSLPPGTEKLVAAARHPAAAAAVATVIGQVVLSKLDRNMRENRWYIVYKKIGPNGEVYIGRCSGFGKSAQEVLDRYDKGHRLKDRRYGDAQILDALSGSITEPITPPGGNTFVLAEISGYSATRGREQQQYAYYKNAGYTMGNAINPVWKYNPLAPTYFAASALAFGPLVPYTDQW